MDFTEEAKALLAGRDPVEVVAELLAENEQLWWAPREQFMREYSTEDRYQMDRRTDEFRSILFDAGDNYTLAVKIAAQKWGLSTRRVTKLFPTTAWKHR